MIFQSEVHQLIVHLVSILQEISKSGTRSKISFSAINGINIPYN